MIYEANCHHQFALMFSHIWRKSRKINDDSDKVNGILNRRIFKPHSTPYIIITHIVKQTLLL